MSVPVLLIGNFLSGASGSRGVCEELSEHLAGRGWTVLTASARLTRGGRLWDMVSTVLKRRRDFAVAHVDVFSGAAFVWAEAACAALRWCGKPYILTLHGGNLPAFAQARPRRVRRLLQSARVVTTPSRYLLEQMAAYRGDLRFLPNALNLNGCRFHARERVRPSLIWLRAFHEIYNPTLAVHAVRLLAAEFPGVRLIMVGPDKGDGSRQRVEQAVAESGLQDRVTWPGKVPKDEVPGWLGKGDIFLNTTNVDNAPVSVLEAMACGLCVVTTNVGGIPYLLTHEHDALLVPPNDPVAMAGAIRRLLTEPVLAGRLSANGRQKVEDLDWSRVLPQWEMLLTAVAQDQPLALEPSPSTP